MRPGGDEPAHSAVRHGAGFVASGLLATAVDAAMLAVLTRGVGLDPFSARLLAIVAAMVTAFFAHRRLTFAIETPPTLAEFTRFLAVAWSASAVNYGLYALVLLARPETPPLLALLAATLVSMAVSYFGMRFGVFARR